MKAAEELLWQVGTLSNFHEELYVIVGTIYGHPIEAPFHKLDLSCFSYNIEQMYTRIDLRLERDCLETFVSKKNEENKFFSRRAIYLVSRTFIHSKRI